MAASRKKNNQQQAEKEMTEEEVKDYNRVLLADLRKEEFVFIEKLELILLETTDIAMRRRALVFLNSKYVEDCVRETENGAIQLY